MFRKSLLICLAMLLLLGGCGRAPVKPGEPEEAETYTRTFTENVAAENAYLSAPSNTDSPEAVCRDAAVIVKAVYLGFREFSTVADVHLFSVAEEYTDRVREQVVHVYEGKETSFISGKTYYLFLSGFLSCFYPHPVYQRCAPLFLIGEDEAGYTFYGNRTLGLEGVTDMGRYLREEIVGKGAYDREAPLLKPETAEEACAGADVILEAVVLSVEDTAAMNPYIRYARYSVERILKGEALYTGQGEPKAASGDVGSAAGLDSARSPLTQAPGDTEIGDRLVLLFRSDPENGGLDMYSLQNACLRADSEEGRYILEQCMAAGGTA